MTQHIRLADLTRALIGAGLFWGAPVGAQPELSFPLDCTLGSDCHIQNYVDHDPGPGFADFACGGLGYDGHKGTDFALASELDIRTQVAVRAAAPGVVLGVRDGMADRRHDRRNPDPNLAGRECGNGVVIDHGEGWQTQYCHLRQGSIAVHPGMTVARGDRLGEVGLSGLTEFAHLHLSVRQGDHVVDPFRPAGLPEGACEPAAQGAAQLWREPLPYQASGWIAAGFAPEVPAYDDIKTGQVYAQSPDAASNLVLWAYAFGGQAEYRVRLEIFGPENDRLHVHEFILPRRQAQFFRAAGLRADADGWPSGRYRGRYALISPTDHVVAEGETVFDMP